MTSIDKKLENEMIIQVLKPLIKKMLDESPEWGNISITLIFNDNKLKRIEKSINSSIQITNEQSNRK